MDFGVAHLEPGELVGEPVAVDAFQLVEGQVSGLDNDSGKRELGQALQLEGERSVGERGGEVVEAFALDRGEHAPVWGGDRVVARRDRRPDRLHLAFRRACFAMGSRNRNEGAKT